MYRIQFVRTTMWPFLLLASLLLTSLVRVSGCVIRLRLLGLPMQDPPLVFVSLHSVSVFFLSSSFPTFFLLSCFFLSLSLPFSLFAVSFGLFVSFPSPSALSLSPFSFFGFLLSLLFLLSPPFHFFFV